MLTQTTSRAGSFKQPVAALRQAPPTGKGRPAGAIELMGALVNRRPTTVVASVVAALIIGLNLFLLQQTFFA